MGPGYFLHGPYEEMYPVWYEWWGVWDHHPGTEGSLGVIDDTKIDDVSEDATDWRHWVWRASHRNVCPHQHGWMRQISERVVSLFWKQKALCTFLGTPFRILNLQDVWSQDPQEYAKEMILQKQLLDSQFPEVPWFEKDDENVPSPPQ